MGRELDPVFEPSGILTKLRIPRLFGEDVERFWPGGLVQAVRPITLWLAPAYGYGLTRVPLAGGAVVAANHLSAIDPPLIGSLSPRAIYYMAKVELLSIPIVGEGLMWTGAFPVRRGEGDRESIRWARKLAREEHVVGMFLEGTRQRFGYPGKPHPGAFMIAMAEGVPVIPCGVYSFGWNRKNRSRCCVVWGHPIDLSEFPRKSKGYQQAGELVGAEVHRLWRLAAEAIVAGYPESLPDGSVRSGSPPVPVLSERRWPAEYDWIVEQEARRPS